MTARRGGGCLDLGGTWALAWSDGQRGDRPAAPRGPVPNLRGTIEAQVPGEIHLDLLRAGLIPDPYTGTGCLASRWVEEYIWFYRREFEAPEDCGRAWLVFEQLDLGAQIFLNGDRVGAHANSFRPCRVDVTGLLRPGTNLVVVELESGLFHVADKQGDGYGMHADVPLHKRHWLRKPQSQFTWDWSTRLINVGIGGPVRLEWTRDPVRVETVAVRAELDEDLRRGHVVVRAVVEGLAAEPVACRLEARVDGDAPVAVEVTVGPGVQVHEVVVPVDEPALWWPIGLGPQTLATVQWTLSRDGQNYGQGLRRVGFRHVNVDQPEDPGGGRRFIVRVNGRPIFCKGANWVPADMVMSRTDRARYQQLVDLAVEANFNFLRVWGGGLYESDDFFDACDERGILVWQEFIFACSRYPATDPEFLADVKLEATHQVRRLAHHPSLVVWCGNNENEWGAWDWGFEKGVALPDHALYHSVLPRILAAEDPSRFYQPSSPWSPDGSHPNADHIGDQHPWSVAFANRDFRDYRQMACRFPNEGGLLGPTSLPTMLQCLEGGPEEVGSFAWRIHDNVNGPHADAMVEEWLGLDPYALSVEEYTYWAGLVQGEGLREYCENFRRRMYASSAAIFWMYNDCWPATRSWTVVDYNLRRTPAFAPVRRAMAPVSVVVALDGERIGVFGVNDTDTPVRARLRFGVLDVATSEYLVDRCGGVELQANASTLLAELPRTELRDPMTMTAFAMLSDAGSVIARGRLFLPRYHEIAWPEAQVRVRVEDGEAVFESDSFAWGVCIDLDGEEALADNFFDVWPGVPHRIAWSRAEAPRVLHIGNALRTAGAR